MTTDPRKRTPPLLADDMEEDNDADGHIINNNNNNTNNTNNNILLSHHQDDDVQDVDEDVVAAAAALTPSTSFLSEATAAGQQQQQQHQVHSQQPLLHLLFPTRIITPSPFPQHNALNSRFRNALVRVTAHPWHDTEAWQAVLTEVSTCYKNMIAPQLLLADASTTTTPTMMTNSVTDVLLQLDWVESCYGCVLHHFPYAVPHIVQLAQVLLAQCVWALARSSNSDSSSSGGGSSHPRSLLAQRAAVANTKLTHLLRQHLGVYPLPTAAATAEPAANEDNPNETAPKDHSRDNSNIDTNLPLCSWSVDLWLLYVEKVQQVDVPATATTTPDERRQAVMDAYEQAVSVAGAVHHDNYKLWQSYLHFVSSSSTEWDNVQKQKLQLRSIYQRCWTHPMANLDALWQAYESLEKQQSEALAASLLQEYMPQYQHARTVHLEASRVVASPEQLQLGRLATPPVGEQEEPATATSATAATATTTTSGKESSGSTANASGTSDDENVWVLRGEEHRLLDAWKVRCAYERTNPARRPPAEWAARVRHAYREMACTLTRHAEVWHMWSTWELLVPTSSSSSSNRKNDDNNEDDQSKHSTTTLPDPVQRSIQILQLGQRHIPDSTLLAWTEATLLERYNPEQSLQVMQRLVQRRPSTLAYVLLQQLVRRYRGMAPARAVFTEARRVLTAANSITNAMETSSSTNPMTAATITMTGVSSVDNSGMGEPTGGAEGMGNSGTTTDSNENGGGRRPRPNWMVTNRLDASIGARNAKTRTKAASSSNDPLRSGMDASEPSSVAVTVVAGPITWHLFAAHAGMEHRINRVPEVAARVYELGLRHHAAFITVPAYVQRYAQLLLELNDKANLRALLTRAVAACGGPQQRGSRSKENLAALWDLTLQYEAILGADDPSRGTTLWEMERKRREAVQGPELEDVATGGRVGGSNDASALIGAQKTTIAELLARTEGYEISSRIVNGMGRTVDVLGLLGLWGPGERPVAQLRSRTIKEDTLEFSGSKSDIGFQKRLQFQQMTQAGIAHDAAAVAEGGAGSKILSARERLAGGTGGPSGSTGAGSGGTAVMLAIQQSPDWLRPLLLLLPASKLRLPLVAKPPPHLTEMALLRLRQNDLPAERPPDDVPKRNKRSRANDGNSSDEDDNGVHSGSSGYGNTFRARQRARMMQQNGT